MGGGHFCMALEDWGSRIRGWTHYEAVVSMTVVQRPCQASVLKMAVNPIKQERSTLESRPWAAQQQHYNKRAPFLWAYRKEEPKTPKGQKGTTRLATAVALNPHSEAPNPRS